MYSAEGNVIGRNRNANAIIAVLAATVAGETAAITQRNIEQL